MHGINQQATMDFTTVSTEAPQGAQSGIHHKGSQWSRRFLFYIHHKGPQWLQRFYLFGLGVGSTIRDTITIGDTVNKNIKPGSARGGAPLAHKNPL